VADEEDDAFEEDNLVLPLLLLVEDADDIFQFLVLSPSQARCLEFGKSA
jgi:hypothetical protein